ALAGVCIGCGALTSPAVRHPYKQHDSRRSQVSEVIRIELGNSLLDAELIVQSLRSHGFRGELVRNEHPETGGFFALGNSALLVLAEDKPEIRAWLEEHQAGR